MNDESETIPENLKIFNPVICRQLLLEAASGDQPSFRSNDKEYRAKCCCHAVAMYVEGLVEIGSRSDDTSTRPGWRLPWLAGIESITAAGREVLEVIQDKAKWENFLMGAEEPGTIQDLVCWARENGVK